MSELKEQRYIIEIAKVQGVAKAAENLFISQPALSKFLTRTEEMYGVQLFERVGKKNDSHIRRKAVFGICKADGRTGSGFSKSDCGY